MAGRNAPQPPTPPAPAAPPAPEAPAEQGEPPGRTPQTEAPPEARTAKPPKPPEQVKAENLAKGEHCTKCLFKVTPKCKPVAAEDHSCGRYTFSVLDDETLESAATADTDALATMIVTAEDGVEKAKTAHKQIKRLATSHKKSAAMEAERVHAKDFAIDEAVYFMVPGENEGDKDLRHNGIVAGVGRTTIEVEVGDKIFKLLPSAVNKA